MWLIKTEHGYMLEDLKGNLVGWFDMACNSKAYCMERGIDPVYLSEKGRPIEFKVYTMFTGKTLWWENE